MDKMLLDLCWKDSEATLWPLKRKKNASQNCTVSTGRDLRGTQKRHFLNKTNLDNDYKKRQTRDLLK